MKPLLIIALLAGQTFYEWTDSSGQTHYTDDPSTIPAKAKRRVTQGAEPVLVTSADGGAAAKRDGGVVAQQPAKPKEDGPNKCELAQQRVREIEKHIADARAQAAADEQAANERCQQQLRQFGDGAFAQCMAARESRVKTRGFDKQLEQAKDELRRVQIDGCN